MLNRAHKRTQKLLNFATKDSIYAEILSSLQTTTFKIEYHWLGHTGSYQAQALNVDCIDDIESTIEQLRLSNDAHLALKLSPRFGTWIMYHTFLHELFHLYQDSMGLFLTPLHIKGQPQFSLDEDSQRTVTLFNEAFAATEAIRASYRLKQNGAPQAWYGALLSPDWHKLARQYEKDLQEMNEEKAASQLFENWHASHLKPHYEQKPLMPNSSPMKLNGISYKNLIALIPEKKRPSYFKNTETKDTLSNLRQGSICALLTNSI